MLTGSIKALIAKYGRQRLVRTMRGYRYLKQSGESGRLNALQYALIVTELGSCQGRCSRLIFGTGVDNAELSIRQYQMVRVSAVVKLNGALLQALGTPDSCVRHYIPPDWQDILLGHGFQVSSLGCSLAWHVLSQFALQEELSTFRKSRGLAPCKSCADRKILLYIMYSLTLWLPTTCPSPALTAAATISLAGMVSGQED